MRRLSQAAFYIGHRRARRMSRLGTGHVDGESAGFQRRAETMPRRRNTASAGSRQAIIDGARLTVTGDTISACIIASRIILGAGKAAIYRFSHATKTARNDAVVTSKMPTLLGEMFYLRRLSILA